MHYPLGTVKRNIQRADRGAVEQLGLYGVATVHEAMGRLGLMHTIMRPIYKGARVSGTAVTLLLHPGDNWMMHVVAEQIQPVTSWWRPSARLAPMVISATCWPRRFKRVVRVPSSSMRVCAM
jgi:hypothetical protein